MLILCGKCGRPLCEIDVPDVNRAKANIVTRTLAGVGLDLPSGFAELLNPTPDQVAAFFNVRCPDGC